MKKNFVRGEDYSQILKKLTAWFFPVKKKDLFFCCESKVRFFVLWELLKMGT